jgi:hypothetical protein
MTNPAGGAVAVLALSGAAAASEESEALYSRGLVELKRGNDAPRWSSSSAPSPPIPSDALAHFHRGVALSKQGKSQGDRRLRGHPGAAPGSRRGGARAGHRAGRERSPRGGAAVAATGEGAARPGRSGRLLPRHRRPARERYDEARASFESARAADPVARGVGALLSRRDRLPHRQRALGARPLRPGGSSSRRSPPSAARRRRSWRSCAAGSSGIPLCTARCRCSTTATSFSRRPTACPIRRSAARRTAA